MGNSHEKADNKIEYIFSLFFIVLFCSVFFVIFGNNKRIAFCDEVYSYTIVNSDKLLKQFELGHFTTGELVRDKITHTTDDSLKQMLSNVNGDNVHPPLYYICLYVSSVLFSKFAGDIVTPWVGLSVNYLFYIFSVMAVWAIFITVFKDNVKASVLTLAFAVNPGTISNMMLIRMYMMYTFAVLLFVFINIQITKGNRKLSSYIVLTISTIFGFLTQYYFALFAIIFFVIDSIYLIVRRKYKDILKYLASMVSTVLLATLIWHKWIGAITGNSHASSMMDNIEGFFSSIGSLFVGVDVLLTSVFQRGKLFFGILTAFVFVAYYVIRRIKKADDYKGELVIKLLFSSLIYSVLVGKITPGYLMSTRYFYAADALFIISFFICFVDIFNMVTKEKKLLYVQYISCGVLLLISVLVGVTGYGIDYYPDKNEYDMQFEKLQEYNDIPWLVSTGDSWMLETNLFDFTIPEDIFVVDDGTPDIDNDILNNADSFLLVAHNEYQTEKIMNKGLYYFESSTGKICEASLLFSRNNICYYIVNASENKEDALIAEFIEKNKEAVWFIINPDKWYNTKKVFGNEQVENVYCLTTETKYDTTGKFDNVDEFIVATSIKDMSEAPKDIGLYYFIGSTKNFCKSTYIGKRNGVCYYLCNVQ